MSIVVEVNVPGLQGPSGPAGVGADPSIIRGGLVPPTYNVGTTYNVGEYVTQNGKEYRLSSAAPVGVFDAQYWQEISTQSNAERLRELEIRVENLEQV